jgi:putative ABC transport system substrate-binding protein
MWGTNDPVGAGFIKSLAHPGGNVTGVAGMFADSIGKSVELLRAVLPTAKRMAVLTSSNPNHPRQYELAEACRQGFRSCSDPNPGPCINRSRAGL